MLVTGSIISSAPDPVITTEESIPSADLGAAVLTVNAVLVCTAILETPVADCGAADAIVATLAAIIAATTAANDITNRIRLTLTPSSHATPGGSQRAVS